MRVLAFFALAAVLFFSACTESGGQSKSEDKSKRPIGMSEEIWKIYGGAESGVIEDKPKDTPQTPAPDKPTQEKK